MIRACHLLLVGVFGLLAASSFAAAPATTEAPPKTRLLVLAPVSQVLDAQTLTTLSGLMVVEVSRQASVDVISPGDVQRLAELESDKQALGCVDNSCLAELAGALGARYVIFGDVGQLGTTYIMNLNLFDNQTASAVNRVAIQASDVGGLGTALSDRMAELVGPLGIQASPSSTPPAEPKTDDGPSIMPWLLVGGGSLVAVAGGAFDVLSGSSRNDQLDPLDAVGPAAYVVGGALLVTGIVFLVTEPPPEAPPIETARLPLGLATDTANTVASRNEVPHER